MKGYFFEFAFCLRVMVVSTHAAKLGYPRLDSLNLTIQGQIVLPTPSYSAQMQEIRAMSSVYSLSFYSLVDLKESNVSQAFYNCLQNEISAK